VKDALQSKELKRKVSNSNKDRSNIGLVVSRDRNKEMNGRGRNKSSSKSRLGGLRCFHYKEIGHIAKNYPWRKKRHEKNESNSNANATVV
jgi:hypothetical protein